MIASLFFHVIRVLGVLLALWLGVSVVFAEITAPNATGTNAPPKRRLSDELFNGPIRTIQIEITETGYESLRRLPRQYVKATVTEAGRSYHEVAFRLKGSAGSFRPIEQKPGFTLNFDKFVASQRFYGLDKFHLNNSVQDPGYMNEILATELFLAAGVPATRGVHARVELNGRDLGLYVLKAGFDKVFLKQHFKNTKGNLYDPGFQQDITEPLKKDYGADPNDRSDLESLTAATDPDLAARFTRLEKVLDLDRFLSFLALEVIAWHWDGYGMNRSNYRLYHDPDSGRMVFLPHGMDQMFGDADGAIFPVMRGVVAKGLLETPEGRRRYLERLNTLRTDLFNPATLANRVDELAARIQPALAESDPALAEQHSEIARQLKERIAERSRSLARQLE
jgi:spore coat protein H